MILFALRLPLLILLYILGTLRETLPESTDEAGVFLSGMCWAFCLHWAVLFFVTWLWFQQR